MLSLLNFHRHNALFYGAVNIQTHILTWKLTVLCYGLHTTLRLGGIIHFCFPETKEYRHWRKQIKLSFPAKFPYYPFTQSTFGGYLINLEMNILESQLDGLNVVLFGKQFISLKYPVTNLRTKPIILIIILTKTKQQRKYVKEKLKVTVQYNLIENSCNFWTLTKKIKTLRWDKQEKQRLSQEYMLHLIHTANLNWLI